MRTIFVLMDSLNRHYLSAYGDDRIQTPNIDELARRGAVFDNHWCGSLPCMPARRELMTGRLNFLETPWGPVEPWDDTLPPRLRGERGVYSHLITDHYHYFHIGGAGYHYLFNSWEFVRGQEGDVWRPEVKAPPEPNHPGRAGRAYWANRLHRDPERDEDYSTPQCFARACDFLDINHDADDWHLHLEVFDPHEPFECPRRYRDLYNDVWDDDELFFNWPNYAPVEEGEKGIEHIRKCYAGTLTMADHWLGLVLERMDKYDMWKDTVLVLTTDHGHLLGEHGYWAKNYMADYAELARIPLVVCSPEATAGSRVTSLTAAMDMAPTFCDLHGAPPLPHAHGESFRRCLTDTDADHHDAVLYGYFGKDVNCTDGRRIYTRQPEPGAVCHLHTATPMDFRGLNNAAALVGAETGDFLPSAEGAVMYRFERPSHRHMHAPDFHPLYDLEADPGQESPIRDAGLESRYAELTRELLERCEAPPCQYDRLGY